jgi:hypothetical protein
MFFVRKIGDFLPTDEEGWIVNPCRSDRLQPLWLDLVEDLKELCREYFGDNLHSLYIRGSVARGCAFAGISDLDSFAIIYEELADEEDKWTASTQRLLKLKYPFCAGVEIGIIPYQNFLKTHHLKVLLKTQSLCIFGEDLSRSLPSYILPSYKPGMDLVRQALLLPNFLKSSEEKLRKLDPKSIVFTTEVKQISAVVGKRMVRAGMDLVVERSRQYTRDLYLCYESFSFYYPEQKLNMKKALELAIAPSENRAGLLVFMGIFGDWLVSEIEAVMGNR